MTASHSLAPFLKHLLLKGMVVEISPGSGVMGRGTVVLYNDEPLGRHQLFPPDEE